MEVEELEKNTNIMNIESISKDTELFVDKYMPKTFVDLLSDDKINREFFAWLKSWDD